MNTQPTKAEYTALIARVTLPTIAALMQSEVRLNKRLAETPEWDIERKVAIVCTAAFTNAMLVAHLKLDDREIAMLQKLITHLAPP